MSPVPLLRLPSGSKTGTIIGGNGATNDAVWAVDLTAGDKLYVEVLISSGATGSASLFLWGPGTTSVKILEDMDKIVAESAYEYTGGSPAPLRLAYVVPTTGRYYIDLYSGYGAIPYTMRARPGPTEFIVNPPSRSKIGLWAGSNSTASIGGTVETALAPAYQGTPVEVWAHWRGYDRNGVDRMYKLGTVPLGADGSWSFDPLKIDSTKMPWTSSIRVEWPGDGHDKGWVDESKTIECYPYVSVKPSRWRIARTSLHHHLGPHLSLASLATKATRARRRVSITVCSRPGRRGWHIIRHYWVFERNKGYYRHNYRPWIKGNWYFKTRYLPAVFNDAKTGSKYTRYERAWTRTIKVQVQ